MDNRSFGDEESAGVWEIIDVGAFVDVKLE